MIKKKSNKSGKMTIDKLAMMVAKGFEDIEKRMATKDDLKTLEERIDIKFEGVKGQIEGVNKRIDDHAFNKVSYDNFNLLVKRVDKLEVKV